MQQKYFDPVTGMERKPSYDGAPKKPTPKPTPAKPKADPDAGLVSKIVAALSDLMTKPSGSTPEMMKHETEEKKNIQRAGHQILKPTPQSPEELADSYDGEPKPSVASKPLPGKPSSGAADKGGKSKGAAAAPKADPAPAPPPSPQDGSWVDAGYGTDPNSQLNENGQQWSQDFAPPPPQPQPPMPPPPAPGGMGAPPMPPTMQPPGKMGGSGPMPPTAQPPGALAGGPKPPGLAMPPAMPPTSLPPIPGFNGSGFDGTPFSGRRGSDRAAYDGMTRALTQRMSGGRGQTGSAANIGSMVEAGKGVPRNTSTRMATPQDGSKLGFRFGKREGAQDGMGQAGGASVSQKSGGRANPRPTPRPTPGPSGGGTGSHGPRSGLDADGNEIKRPNTPKRGR